MKMNKKRGILIASILFGLAILVFVLADSGYLLNTTGTWREHTEQTEITTLTLYDYQLGGYGSIPVFVNFCNNSSPDICVNGQPIATGDNIVKTWISDLSGVGPGPISFEVYEKDTGIGEDGQDDAIRTGTHKLNGFIKQIYERASYNYVGTAPWSISLQDIVSAGQESDGYYEFYFKAITQEGYTKTYNAILRVNVIWTGNLEGMTADWYDKTASHIIESVNVDALDLLDSRGGGTNLVNIKALNVNAATGTPVVFEILDKSNIPIRTGPDALVGLVQVDKSAKALWIITFDDLNTAKSNQFYFRVALGQYGMSVVKYLLVNIDYTNLIKLLVPGWLNFGLNPITDIQFNSVNLDNPTASQNNSVYVDLSGFPTQTNGQKLTIEIWEKDATLVEDDAIRTDSKALTATIDANGRARTLWKLNPIDIINAEPEPYYDFYYKIIFNGNSSESTAGPATKGLFNNSLSFRDNSLNVTIDGSVAEPNILDASGEWKDEQGSITIIQYGWDGLNPNNKVTPYSFNIDAPQGTQITVEIWEKDAVGGDDAIKTIGLGNALTGVVNNFGGVYVFWWDITQDDLTNASSDDSNEVYEFYFKIKYGTQEKSFDDVILEVSKTSSTCINVNYCTDYLEDIPCNQDSCGVANQTGTIYNIVCSDPGMNCGCIWNLAQGNCNFIFSNQNGSENGIYGNCQYLEQGEDDCTDGILSFSWTGNWSWATGNSFLTQGECETSCGVGNCTSDGLVWHCDPAGAETQCDSQSNSNSINCPAKVQLPGFNWINVVLIAVGLVLIYFLIAWKRKSNKLKKKRK